MRATWWFELLPACLKHEPAAVEHAYVMHERNIALLIHEFLLPYKGNLVREPENSLITVGLRGSTQVEASLAV